MYSSASICSPDSICRVHFVTTAVLHGTHLTWSSTTVLLQYEKYEFIRASLFKLRRVCLGASYGLARLHAGIWQPAGRVPKADKERIAKVDL